MDGDADGSLERLAREIGELRDLFHRRLLEDKAKQRLFDELYAQVELARKGLSVQVLEPLFREELLILDRLERYQGDDPDFVRTVHAELNELLNRRGVDAIRVDGAFDPRFHEAVETVPTTPSQVGHVVSVRRRGYVIAERVLRPAQVVVGGKDVTILEADLSDEVEPSS